MTTYRNRSIGTVYDYNHSESTILTLSMQNMVSSHLNLDLMSSGFV